MGKEDSVIKPAVVKCLLVDDLDENLLALSALVRRDGVEVLTARSGAAALEILLKHEVALALVDVQMPDMDGFELGELMRGSERTRSVPIIFVTAGVRDHTRMFKGYEAGAVDFLYKPVEPHILRNKVDVFFQLYRQQQQLREELLERTETLRLHEMFTAVLGHDLRNPLSAVLMAADAIQRRTTEDASRRQAERIVASAKWMGRLVEDMLDLARARLAGGIALARQPVDLGLAIQHALQDLRAAHPERLIEFTSSGNLTGEWDVDRCAQVASNLIGNALQHGDPDGPVSVSADGTDPHRVMFAVENAGSIPPNLLEHVFDPFRSGDPRTSRKGGLGLGLYIVQQIVKAHAGTIAVDCARDGRTRFVVVLPRVDSHRPDTASATAQRLAS